VFYYLTMGQIELRKINKSKYVSNKAKLIREADCPTQGTMCAPNAKP